MPPFEAGAIVGSLRLDALLGRGGMGEVWAATDTLTQARYAVKLLTTAAGTADARRRFVREARAAGGLRHPSVVLVHGVLETDDGTPALVMDLLHGETLRRRLTSRDRLTLAETARVLVPVADAVAAGHQAGIIHRDLKPDNVFLESPHDRVKVLDFGLAKLTATSGTLASSGALTETGSVMGTPGYMSPEQMYGESDIDGRTDVWSLGVLLYECLAGGRPLEGKHPGVLVRQLHREGITPLERVVPDLPGDVAWLASRMLAVDRQARIADVTAVASVLAKYR